MLGPLHQNERFFEGAHPIPLKHEISTLPAKSQTFYTMNIFLIAPKDLHFFGSSGEPFERT